MPSFNDFTTEGKVLAVSSDGVVFGPSGTNYELYLKSAGTPPAVGTLVDALIRVQGRKIWTVASGGNFIVPIVGPPRIVQGWVKHLDEKWLAIKAGAQVIVEMPA